MVRSALTKPPVKTCSSMVQTISSAHYSLSQHGAPGEQLVGCYVSDPRRPSSSWSSPWVLEAAVDWAPQRGAPVLDGYQVDTEGLSRTPSPSAVFTGTLARFRPAGFVEIGRTYPTRPVMRRELLHR